jgi:hypothetical protein
LGGGQISKITPLLTSWGDDRLIYLAAPLDLCFKVLTNEGHILTKPIDLKTMYIDNKSISLSTLKYQILAEVPLKQCQELSPHIVGNCEKSFLISIFDDDYHSRFIYYNIYGLFSIGTNKKFILPLKNFYKKNDAINYIKNIN